MFLLLYFLVYFVDVNCLPTDSSISTSEEGVQTLAANKSFCVYDPTYDATYKSIFDASAQYEYGTYKYTGIDNLMNFLNSLYYPDAGENGFKIREARALNTERMSGSFFAKGNGSVSTTKIVRYDNPYRCTAYSVKDDGSYDDTTKYTFDVEMQKSIANSTWEEYCNRILYYATQLHVTSYAESYNDVVDRVTKTGVSFKPLIASTPVKIVTLLDSCISSDVAIFSHSLISAHIGGNGEVIYGEIPASANISFLFLQLPKFVNERTFIATDTYRYIDNGKIYSLSWDALQWIKLFCSNKCGEPSSEQMGMYTIELSEDSTAIMAANVLENCSEEVRIGIAYENSIDMFDAKLVEKLNLLIAQKAEAEAQKAEAEAQKAEAEAQKAEAEAQKAEAEAQKADLFNKVVYTSYRLFRELTDSDAYIEVLSSLGNVDLSIVEDTLYKHPQQLCETDIEVYISSLSKGSRKDDSYGHFEPSIKRVD